MRLLTWTASVEGETYAELRERAHRYLSAFLERDIDPHAIVLDITAVEYLRSANDDRRPITYRADAQFWLEST